MPPANTQAGSDPHRVDFGGLPVPNFHNLRKAILELASIKEEGGCSLLCEESGLYCLAQDDVERIAGQRRIAFAVLISGYPLFKCQNLGSVEYFSDADCIT